MDVKHLKEIFGTDNPDEIVQKKTTTEHQERASKPKVSRAKITADECKALCKSVGLKYLGAETIDTVYGKKKYAGYEERVFQYTFTDETVDHYGDVIVAKGVDLKTYQKNPVVLAFHNGRSLPVGRSIKTWYDAENNDVRGWVLILDERVDNTGVSETIYKYLDAGAMTTGSVGFVPKENKYHQPDEEERTLWKMPKYGVIYDEVTLIEFSMTPVPANPSAAQKDVQLRGIYSVDNLELARGVFDDEFIEACRKAIKAEQKPDPKYQLTLDANIAEKLDYLANKLTILCEKLDLHAASNSRIASVLSKGVPQKGGDTPKEPDGEYQSILSAMDELV